MLLLAFLFTNRVVNNLYLKFNFEHKKEDSNYAWFSHKKKYLYLCLRAEKHYL